MKYYSTMLILVILIHLFVGKLISGDSQSISNLKRIKSDITIYNTENQGEFRDAILKYFGSQVKKEELDSLIIVGEPVATITSNIKKDLSMKDIKISFLLNEIWNYYVSPNRDSMDIYYAISIPKFYCDTNSISFRLYTPSKKHKYELMIINSRSHENRLEEDTSNKIYINLIDLEDSTDIASHFYKKYPVPYEDIRFSIDYNTYYLPNCIINDDKIYSLTSLKLEALKENYDNFSLLPKEKWINSEISVYLSNPPFLYTK